MEVLEVIHLKVPFFLGNFKHFTLANSSQARLKERHGGMQQAPACSHQGVVLSAREERTDPGVYTDCRDVADAAAEINGVAHRQARPV